MAKAIGFQNLQNHQNYRLRRRYGRLLLMAIVRKYTCLTRLLIFGHIYSKSGLLGIVQWARFLSLFKKSIHGCWLLGQGFLIGRLFCYENALLYGCLHHMKRKIRNLFLRGYQPGRQKKICSQQCGNQFQSGLNLLLAEVQR